MGEQYGVALSIEDRRVHVADLYVKGWTQREIASHLNVSQGLISQDMTALRAEWRASRLEDTQEFVDLELRKLDRLEREAWAAWDRSQKPAQEATTVTKDGADMPTKKKISGRNGDPRYLAVVAKCIERRCALLGLDAPKQLTMDDSQIDQFIIEEVERLARAYAATGGGVTPAITVEAREVGPGLGADDPPASSHHPDADSNGHHANGSAG